MKLYYLIIGLFFSSTCLAGEATGKVIDLRASNTSNSVVFAMSRPIEEPASCNEWQMFGIDIETPAGHAVFELVRLAFLHELDIEVHGLGTCIAHWRSEDVKDVAIKKPAT